MGGAPTVLGLCEGGSELLSGLVVLGAAVIYGLAAAALFRGAKEEAETTKLAYLFVAAGLFGAVLFVGVALWESDERTAGFVFTALALAGSLAAVAKWHGKSLVRAVFLALLGIILVPGGIVLLFYASFAIGNACLE